MLYNGLDRVVLLVNSTTIKGNTRIQKYGFLTAQLYRDRLKDLDFYSDWKAYDYGPYSYELADDVKKCVKNGVLQTEDASNGITNNYSLTAKGRIRLSELSDTHSAIIKELFEKFSELNRQKMGKILRDIYEAYPTFAANSKIKGDVLKSTDGHRHEPYIDNRRLNPEIERKLELIESGKYEGKTYTIPEFRAYVKQILEE